MAPGLRFPSLSRLGFPKLAQKCVTSILLVGLTCGVGAQQLDVVGRKASAPSTSMCAMGTCADKEHTPRR